jgi:hypothetical protein
MSVHINKINSLDARVAIEAVKIPSAVPYETQTAAIDGYTMREVEYSDQTEVHK